jgi:antitoxin MazE
MKMAEQIIIRPWGNSQGVRLTKSMLEKANMVLSDVLEVEISENVIVLRKIPRHRSFEERLAEHDGKITICDYDWGEPAGKEMV